MEAGADNSTEEGISSPSLARNSKTARLKLGGRKKINSLRLKLEVALVVCLILIVWGILSLPIVFFHLPVEDVRYIFISHFFCIFL